MLFIIGIAAVVLAWGVSRWTTSRATAAADAAAAQAARTHLGLLASELQKFRLLPLVLVEYPEVAAVLEAPNPAAEQRLNALLELLAQRTDAAAIYVLDAQGRTRAASNWRLPTSFIGQNYAFRPYFRDAMRSGASELFALGTVSGRPGLYLARRIDRTERALGTIIVKVEFDRVEANWAQTPGITFVTDPHGVILVTSVPGWRFGATAPLDPKTLRDARRTLQFGPAPPRRLPISFTQSVATAAPDGPALRYRVAAIAAPLSASRLYHLSPLQPQLAAARTQALLWASGALLIVGALGVLVFRQAEKQRLQRQARQALEHEVARRTAELSDTNARLLVESQERAQANARFQAAREELAQANRLGTLGQITAGMAHEINQPVAAIRTFAENGQALIDRARTDAARANLAQIVELTERIGTITAELRSFARRKTPSPVQAELGSVLDGALLLIGESARGVVTVKASRAVRRCVLAGDRVRHEQVLINLLRNALDAVQRLKDPAVTVTAEAKADVVHITVVDNGDGIDPSVSDTLFTPFATAKADGLGLGLAIARDIAREFGGDLVLLTRRSPGAAFLLTLRTT